MTTSKAIKALISAILLFSAASGLSAQELIEVETREAIATTDSTAISAIPADSLATPDPYPTLPCERFRPTQLIAPGAMIALGTYWVYNGWLRGISRDIRRGMNSLRGDHYCHIDDYFQYLPVAAYLTVGFIPGAKPRHNFTQRIMAGATAYILMTGCVNAMKYSIRERRPDSGARNSFPSGHTATAFVGAELMRLEYGNAIGAGAYAVATGVAFLRLYNNRHWINDVIAGAGIGILSAQAAYWLLPLERKLFKIKDTQRVQCSVVPSYSPFDRSLAISTLVTF